MSKSKRCHRTRSEMVKISGQLCRYVLFSRRLTPLRSPVTHTTYGEDRRSQPSEHWPTTCHILCKMQEFDAPRSPNTDKTMGFHSAKHRVSSELGDTSMYTLSDLVVNQVNTLKNGSGISSVSLDTVSAVTVLTVTADCVRYIQNAECPDNTLHCDLEQHLVHNTCSSAAALTGQVLLQVTVHCNLRTTSIEKTYRLVPNNKSLQLCHRRSSTQLLSAASAIMQSSVVVGKITSVSSKQSGGWWSLEISAIE